MNPTNSTEQLPSDDRIARTRAPRLGRSGTNRDWLLERARELGLQPPAEMRPLHVRSLRSAI